MEWIWVLNLGLTGGMTLWTVRRKKKYGAIKACVIGAGFFTVAFYLDIIFWLIMGGMAAESTGNGMNACPGLFLQILGMTISKSILAAGMIIMAVMGRKPGSVPEETESDMQYGYPGEKDGLWLYLEALTMGISLFFLLLASGCLWYGRSAVSNALAAPSGSESMAGKIYGLALLMTSFLFLLAIYYASLLLCRKKQCEERRRFDTEVRKEEAALYLGNAEEQYQRMRELWHDLKNHLGLLDMLLCENKYEEMKEYLRIFGEDVDRLTLPVKSGNPVVDALLADKAARAKKGKVAVEISLCDLSEIHLRPDEICSLLGNLLDNALEANALVPEDRFLSVDCREREDCYYIKIQNAVNTVEKQAGQGRDGARALESRTERGGERNMPRSRKTDGRNRVGHGLGLRSVERVVHGCGGEMIMDSGDGWFAVVVRLPKSVPPPPSTIR